MLETVSSAQSTRVSEKVGRGDARIDNQRERLIDRRLGEPKNG